MLLFADSADMLRHLPGETNGNPGEYDRAAETRPRQGPVAPDALRADSPFHRAMTPNATLPGISGCALGHSTGREVFASTAKQPKLLARKLSQ
jgi:hypothetical protein